MEYKTIVAIASGKINQAISILRMSGPDSFGIISKIFTGPIQDDKKISYGFIKNTQNEIIDEVMVAFFKGNKNFVGEDTIEIYAHGGVVVSNLILNLLLEKGASLAEPGEFSKRAFLNGKMDLIKADAINDLINSKSVFQAKQSSKQLNNNVSKKIDILLDELLFIIATCETNIDYPEYDDIEIITTEVLMPKLDALINKLEIISNLSQEAQDFYNGIKIAIVGMPNVGKSSLLNSLLEENKAIVTDIEGTTRDIVEGEFQLNGFTFLLQDTAGIRKTENIIEKIGIDKTFESIEKSKIVLHILDATNKNINNDLDNKIKELSKDKIYFEIYNKSDLVKENNKNIILISAKNNEIDNLKNELIKITKSINFDNENIIYSSRQISLVFDALRGLKEAKNNLELYGPDVIIVDLREAWESLENIKGRADNELLLDKMFKNFCLGK